MNTTLCMQVCPRDFLPSLLKWADAENLPEYLGGTSKATLLDDAGPWNDHEILQVIFYPFFIIALSIF